METLPEHILIEIFKQLPTSQLRELSMVCKRWSQAIKSSNFLTKDLEISIETHQPSKKRSRFDQLTIDIPIPDIKYEKLSFKVPRWNRIIMTQQNQVRETLEAHQACIKHLKLTEFTSNDFFGCEFLNVTHLELRKYFKSSWEPKFENLTHLTMDVNVLKHTKFLKQSKFNLKHLSIKFHLDILYDSESKAFLKFALRHKETLEELIIVGLSSQHLPFHWTLLGQLLVSDKLKYVEMETYMFADELTLVNALNKDKTWSEIEFTDSQRNDQTDINKIIMHNQKVERIKFTQKKFLPIQIEALSEFTNLEVVTFVFRENDERNIYSFRNIDELEISRIDNEYQLSKLIEQLRPATNLKILRIRNISLRACTDRKMQQILMAVKNLEELYMDAYSKHFELSSEALEVIKNDAKNLKKLTIGVASEKFDQMKEKIKIFTNSNIKAAVIRKEIQNTCLESNLLNGGVHGVDFDGTVRYKK